VTLEEKDNFKKWANCKCVPANASQPRSHGESDSVQGSAAGECPFPNDLKRCWESETHKPIAGRESAGSDTDEALLKTQIVDEHDMEKRILSNLTNCGRDNNAPWFTKAMYNCFKMHKKRFEP
jgi:hypothetical protein